MVTLPLIIDSVFITIDFIFCYMAWKIRINHAILVHMIFFTFFIPCLQLLSAHENIYNIDVYLASHLACMGYLFIVFLLGYLFGNIKIREIDYANVLIGIKDKKWGALVYIWFVYQLYLIQKYGLASLYIFSGESESDSMLLSYADSVINSLLFYSALGGLFVYISKLALLNEYYKKIKNLAPILLFISLFIVVLNGGGNLGVRRTLFIMVIYYGVLVIIKNRGEVRAKLILHRKKLIFAVLSLLLVSWYYQNIRHNMYLPEVYENVLSNSVYDQLRGVGYFLVPSTGEDDIEPVSFFREGPFVLINDIINSRYYHQKSTDGELFAHELLKVIPRVIYPGKDLETDVDEIFADRMDLYPSDPYLKLDLSTSVLAIMLADMGFLGVIFSPLLLFFVITLLTWLIVYLRNYQVTCVFLIGALIYLVCNVEGGLAAIFGTMRDVGIVCFLTLPVILLVYLVRRMLSIAIQHKVSG